MQHLPAGADQFVDGFNHMHRNADRAGLIGNTAGDRLPDPPGRIGGKLVSTPVFKFVDGLHQANIAFLNQIQKLQTAIGVFLGN